LAFTLGLGARKLRGDGMDLRAIVIVNGASQARLILEGLSRKGFVGIIESDPQAVLETCRGNPPDLVIVEHRLTGMTGVRFLSRLVSISWTTSAILIVDEQEEVVHEMTEGLGILGHMRNCEDTASLDRLLDKLHDMNRSDR
jgi:DNA-binding NtrC family response regulator